MESNAPCLVLPNADNYCNNNYLSTGYLEDALIEFSVRFKRRKFTSSSSSCSTIDRYDEYLHDPIPTQITDDLSYWNNWLTNYSMHSNEELSHARLLIDHDMHYSLFGESTETSMKEMSEEQNYYPDTNTLLLEEIVGGATSPKLKELSSCSTDSSLMKKSNDFVYTSDTYSTDSSSIYGDMEIKKKTKMTTKSSNPTKMVYPFGLVKPGAEDGDITLKDINKRLLMPPTRPIKHPVGDFACRPIVSQHGLGLSGKAVVALTKIQTQGRGTITIIRTKG